MAILGLFALTVYLGKFTLMGYNKTTGIHSQCWCINMRMLIRFK